MTNSSLEDVAIEMQQAASANPMDMIAMAQGIVAEQFPDSLSRYVMVDGHEYRIQFSHDVLPTGKTLAHLSFRGEGAVIPDDTTKQRFQRAFFGESTGVMLLPSLHGQYVTQMAKII